jgi:hypothetical protein
MRRASHTAMASEVDAFSFGTYAMRTMHGAAVEPSADPQAIVAQPGPLLCDVQARLREKRQSSEDGRERSISLMENVCEELEQEAEAADEMDFSQTPETTEHDNADVVTRHRTRAWLVRSIADRFGACGLDCEVTRVTAGGLGHLDSLPAG